MRAFLALLGATLRQLLGGRRIIPLALMGLLPAVVVAVLVAQERTAVGAREVFHDAPITILFFIVLPVASLVFGAGALGDERRDGTLSFILLRPLPRSLLAGAKLLGAWLATLAVVGVGAACMSVILGLRFSDWGTLGPLLLAVALSSLSYVSVFLVLGYLTQRAVLIGLVYAFIWESGMTTAVTSLATVSLMRIGLSAYAGLVPASRAYLADMLGAVQPGAGGAVAKAVVIAVLAVASVAGLLRYRDVA
ncbi:MAG TPA: ABC transporter permease [Acidimicrobiia bacterium]|nr:ABC transporter permease [Acidimicrobiia bacterium]